MIDLLNSVSSTYNTEPAQMFKQTINYRKNEKNPISNKIEKSHFEKSNVIHPPKEK